ncbi:MAG: alpha/beta hydrolase [Saprospiraceae bacterium]|nr:alpha/beta hydrolase [Saprospiraceae bacterium]
MWKKIKMIWFSTVTLLFCWYGYAFQSRNLPDGTWSNDARVTVLEEPDQILFRALQPKNSLEVIFFQGGLADPKAYAPLCRQLAAQGYTCHLIKMAWRMPQHDYRKVQRLFDFGAGHYVLGGHSQGAKIAAQVVYENPGLLKGLFLLGTSHPRDIDLSPVSLPALKLYAEHDGLASPEEVLANQHLLPARAKLVSIPGGNHSQFGYLGRLLGDDGATITLEQQQTLVLEQLRLFLDSIPDQQ